MCHNVDWNTKMVISSNLRNLHKDAHSEVRTKIVQAAEERLWHFGFKKTTIDEIAADAGIGKGTIYLHFGSKEEIALEIIAQFKQQSLDTQRTLAADQSQPILDRIKAVLLHPILMSHTRCSQSPAAVEFITSIRPNITAHLEPFVQQEQEILAQVLEEGNLRGIFRIDDTKATAQTLKRMCAGFLPPFPILTGERAISEAVSSMVELACHGFRAEGAAAF